MELKKRIEWLDFLRVFAIFGVVLCHVAGTVYKFNLPYISGLGLDSGIFAFSIFTIGRMGVPCFLMISGYLLLDRTYNFEKTKSFWINNWLHLLACTEVWFLIYELFKILCEKKQLTFFEAVGDLLFVHDLGMGHVWYMPMILGMYVLVPFAANALQSYEMKNLYFPVLFFSLYAFGYPFFSVLNQVLGNASLSLEMSLGFSGGYFGVYFILGYMIRNGLLEKVKTGFLIFTAVLSFVAAVWLQIWSYSQDFAYNIWYDSPYILISSAAVFELFSRISFVPAYQIVKWLSCYSFAVYLIHMPVRNVIQTWIMSLTCMHAVKAAVLWLLVVMISYFCAWLIGRIPKIGKYILYVK